MWGIRAIRVGVFLSGLLVTIAGSGCCESCQHLWKGEKAVPTSQPNTLATGDDKDPEKVLSEWRPQGYGVKNQTIPPERIHGGIN